MAADHVVEIWHLSDHEDKYELVAVTKQRMADSARLFSMNYEGGLCGSCFIKVGAKSTLSLGAEGGGDPRHVSGARLRGQERSSRKSH